MNGMSTAARRHTPWLRMTSFALALAICVLLPFALWGDGFDRHAPLWLQAQPSPLVVALFGVCLLVIDVVLPVPSSVVSTLLCWQLGPTLGGLAVASGVFLAFVTGYGLGRLLPEPRLRAWIGPDLWDAARSRARNRALWWIVLARPLPVLAELSAVLAGVWRVPPAQAFASAAAASSLIGMLYGGSAWIGTQAPSTTLLAIASGALPTVLWVIHRRLLQRVSLRRPTSEGGPQQGLSGQTQEYRNASRTD